MESVFLNGGFIGQAFDILSTTRYVVSTSPATAIELVGTPTNSVSSSITLPTGLQEGDLVIICSFGNNNTQTLPAEYTNGQNGNVNSVQYRWSYKFMGESPDTTATGLASSSAHLAFAFRGVDTTTPLDVTPPTRTTNTAGMPNPPAITTITNDSVLVAAGFLDDDSITPTAPSTYTLLGSRTSSGTVMAAYKTLAIAGADDPAAFGGAGTDSWVGATFALRKGNVTVFGNLKNSGIWSLPAVYSAILPYTKDANFSSVSLLLHGDGTNGSTTFTDNSLNAFAVTGFGNAQISTARSKFGGASMLFDGTGDYLTAAYDVDLDLIGNAFTVEAWLYRTATKTGGHRIFSTGGGFVGWNATTGIHVLLQLVNAGQNLNLQLSTNTGTPINIVSSAGVPINTWTHVAATFNGTTDARLFVNGVQETFTIASPLRPSTNPTVAISTIPGEAGSNSTAFQGYIDDLRITKGVARYTSSFTVPPFPYPNA